jgi:hypothetical protein
MYSITVITYVSDCTVSESTGITHLGDTDTVVRDIGDNCDRVQVSLILGILIQYSQRQVIILIEPVLYHSYHLSLTVLYQYHQDE